MRPPVQIAVWPARSVGAFVEDVLVQLSVTGSYRLPVLCGLKKNWSLPPHTTMRLPVQTAVCRKRAGGASVVDVGVQVSAAGSYRPPVSEKRPWSSKPPHTTM